MTEPVVYVSTWKVKVGKFDAYARLHERLANTVWDLEPRVAAFLAFANDDGTEVTGIHVFPDADARCRYCRHDRCGRRFVPPRRFQGRPARRKEEKARDHRRRRQ
jgi:hypothetical protein